MKKKLLVLLLSTCLAVQSLPVYAVEPEENLQQVESLEEVLEDEEEQNVEITELQEEAEEPEMVMVASEELPDRYMCTKEDVTYWAESPEILQKMLSGQDITDYELETLSLDNDDDVGDHPVTLKTPSGLCWDSKHPGKMYWNAVKGSEGEYELEIYKDGEIYLSGFWSDEPDSGEADADQCMDIEESGTYKFRVRAGNEWGSDNTPISAWSEWSSEWTYVKPEGQLAAPQGLTWQKTAAEWNKVSGSGGYEVRLFHEGREVCGAWSHSTQSLSEDFRHDIERYGNGNYYFQVRTLSGNIEKICPSDFSRKSPSYGTDGTANVMNAALQTAIEGIEDDPDQALGTLVDDTDVDEMAVAMNTDSQTLQLIEELESAYADKKNISVMTQTDSYASAYLDSEKIGVIGAALNAESSDQEMVLNFSKLDQEMDEENFSYRMKNWIQFSIDLTGRKDQETLLVPVRITVPIPKEIVPELFVILHYHQDGTYEEIRPILNGDGTASFTVTSFSPFVLATELIPATDLELNKENMALEKTGDQGTLHLTVTPADSNSDLVWTSDDEKIATVKDGVVTAVSKGITTIKVSAKDDPEVSAECRVAVAGTLQQGSDDAIYLEDLGLWMKDIPDQTYTGKALTPEVEIYDNKTLLAEGRDYKLAWKDNLNVGTALIIVTGQGSYSGKGGAETAVAIPFTIVPKTLQDTDIVVSDCIAASQKEQKVTLKVTDGKKTLKEKKDYTLEENELSAGTSGTVTVTIKGTGNYTGVVEKKIQVVDLAYLLNKASVAIASKAKKKEYTGKAVELGEGELTVKLGKNKLVEGKDYTLQYKDNTEVGTATVSVVPAENSSYVGSKSVSFAITGKSITKAALTGIPTKVTYTGKEIKPEITLTDKTTKEVISADNYEISYSSNLHAGKAVIEISGKGNYTGTIKKTFTIEPKELTMDDISDGNICLDGEKYQDDVQYEYISGGVKPVMSVTYGKDTLTGKMSWKNTDKVTDPYKMASATLTLTGDYKGKITVSYGITKAELKASAQMSVQDMTYQSKAGKYKAIPALIDKSTGKTLKAGKDYDKNLTYTYADGENKGEKIPNDAILKSGTKVCVTTEGMGNYEGELSATYNIVKASIASAIVKVKDQIYTGKSCLPSAEDVTVTIGKTTLEVGKDYKIVEDGSDITNVGTRTFKIVGVGENYGGTKGAKVKIRQKNFVWWFLLH